MPPRLAHKKSRKGCARCKTRKVKCTEEWPVCAACLRHSLPCRYDQESPRVRSTSQSRLPNLQTSVPADNDVPSTAAARKSSSSVLGPATPYSLEDDVDALSSDHFQRRLLELRLLHHYTTVVALNMPASKRDSTKILFSSAIRNLYIVDMVELGFEYPFLLNTIFAIAALHKMQPQLEAVRAPGDDAVPTEAPGFPQTPANTPIPKPTEVAEYARVHRIYLNIAIRQQREALTDLNSKSADAVCLNSILLSVIALKLLPEESIKHYTPPIQWLQMAHAISTVVNASEPFLPAKSTMRKIIADNEPDFKDKRNIFEFEHIPPFRAILEFPENPYPDKEESLTYNLAVSYMAAIYRGIQNSDPQRQIARRITSTAPVLPKLFVELVEQRRPKALVILAYIMSMIKYVEDYWFFRGTAEHEVYGIQSILPSEWQWAMEWPVKMLATLAEPKYRNLGA